MYRSVSVLKQDKRQNELHGLRKHLIETIFVQLEIYTVTQFKC